MTPAVVDRLSIDSMRLLDAARERSCIHALVAWMLASTQRALRRKVSRERGVTARHDECSRTATLQQRRVASAEASAFRYGPSIELEPACPSALR
jgi:hypothetical protein